MYPDATKIISGSWGKFPSLRKYVFALNRISDEASKNADNVFKTYFNPNEDGVAVQIITATNKFHENYLIINKSYINKFISFVFKKEEFKKKAKENNVAKNICLV
jgi:hypothetical protein